ncbi:hypothetical protein [Algoriphagus boritolerans]|uniref:6-bladed beta-propeller protein n=1 Tax=Algoriphagus boritolerans DSM 17298 = JCM 18970 TaxID=1120964 RepID=A0A1H5YGK5_9BACT|nr:hypothetical protein [Algoriphagus boritolerans]SEG23178.1 hypothetical protein SAMN03080598_02989 [Algoriphagus boritolerans DSM 17298 = JCM 18970]
MRNILIILSVFILYSCSSDKEKISAIFESNELKIFRLEKIDSVQINFIGTPRIHDINPQSKSILFLDDGPHHQTINIANFDGEIINSFTKFGDVPDSYGILLSCIRLINDKSFLVYGSNGFLKFDFSGNLLSKVKLKSFEVPDRAVNKMGFGMEKLYEEYLFFNQEFPPNRDYSTKSFLYSLNLMKLLNPETGEIRPFLNFPDESIFRNGKHFFRSAWDPVFYIDEELVYIVFGLEPTIYVYNPITWALESNIPVDFKEFRNFKGAESFSFEIEAFMDRFRSAFINNIKKINGVFIIAYFPGYDAEDLEESRMNKSKKENMLFYEKVNKKYKERIAIVDSLGTVLNDFVPEGLEPSSMLLRNGQLWMMERADEEVERDYFRLFRVGLKIENK